MKELQKQFAGRGEVKGYTFNQITATPYGYIYEKTSEEGGNTFEVFKRKENAYYDCVSYPTSKAFGIWAWAVGTLEKAEEKLTEIMHKEARKLTVH